MVAADMLSHGLLAGIGAGLLVGLVCGALNGVLIAKLKLPDFIVTLGTLSIFRGAALIYTDGQPIYGLPPEFRAIFAGQHPRHSDAGDPGAGDRGPRLPARPLHRARRADHRDRRQRGGGRLSGINIERVKITVYAISGVLSSIAGFVLIARIGAAEPIGGNGFELQAIGSAVIGGASLFGGIGNPLGSLDRRADAGRAAERADADERAVLLAVRRLGRRRHPRRLRRPVDAPARMTDGVRHG